MLSISANGEAEINQSLVDLQTNFAFKRVKDKSSPEKGFRALVSALLIHQNARIRRHPNVAKLMGVCWEVDQQSGNIWPVLVSEKAPLGDLRQFLNSEQGTLLSVEDRIQLCVDVMLGIQALHASGTFVVNCYNIVSCLICMARYHTWRYRAGEYSGLP